MLWQWRRELSVGELELAMVVVVEDKVGVLVNFGGKSAFGGCGRAEVA